MLPCLLIKFFKCIITPTTEYGVNEEFRNMIETNLTPSVYTEKKREFNNGINKHIFCEINFNETYIFRHRSIH